MTARNERWMALGHDAPLIQENWSVLCDFDGTISHQDVTDSLLRTFGQPGWEAVEEQWERGEIGSRVCLTRQVELLRMTVAQLYDHLTSITLDAAFPAFLDVARARGMPVQILSDGLAQAIAFVLQRHGISGLPIYANALESAGETRWRLRTPYFRHDCPAASAHCKCSQLSGTTRRTLYIGDGSSDFCIAAKADMVLAKGKLADYCRARGIDHHPIHDFNDALVYLSQRACVMTP